MLASIWLRAVKRATSDRRATHDYWVFSRFEEWIDFRREVRTYEIVCLIDPDKIGRLEQAFRECGLRLRSHKQVKSGGDMTCIWEAEGSPKNHARLTTHLFADDIVKEFRY